jgi:hypothetical protein
MEFFLEGFYSYSVFENLSIVDYCPVDMNLITLKTGALQTSPYYNIAIFRKRL